VNVEGPFIVQKLVPGIDSQVTALTQGITKARHNTTSTKKPKVVIFTDMLLLIRIQNTWVQI
jgi:hypothetical protein